MTISNQETELGMRIKIEEAARTCKTWVRHYWIYQDDETGLFIVHYFALNGVDKPFEVEGIYFSLQQAKDKSHEWLMAG